MDWFLLALKNYATFTGRARRKEYWMFVLFYVLILFGLSIVDALLGTGFFGAIFVLGMVIPSIAAAVRRLHDTGRSGWWMLIGFIPLVGLVLIYFLVLDSDASDNAYGPSPKLADGAAAL
ncbi:MAG TPA: DUF805 domain-containing protein [Burkholderiaceae bacterium]